MLKRIICLSAALLIAVSLLLPFRSAVAAEGADTDNDGLSDMEETTIYFTDPHNPDTDGDTYTDGEEVRNGYSPHVPKKKLTQTDYDNDKLNDALELALNTNLNNPDTDGDGHSDGQEVSSGFNPLLGGNDKSLPRRAEVDLSVQRLQYYLNNVKIGSMPVSTGLITMPTPTGEFKIIRKLPVHRYTGVGYDLPNTKWNLEFKHSFYLHGAYWHNQFGKRPMSHGCVNIAYQDAQKLYGFLDVGDSVRVVGKTPRGALAQK